MKIFVVHSNRDNNIINENIKEIEKKCPNAEILILTGHEKFWHYKALKKIKQADVALYFVGKESSVSKSIKWELKKFKKFNKKIYTIKLDENNKYNYILYRKEMFSNAKEYRDKYLISTEVNIGEITEIINCGAEINVSGMLCQKKRTEKNVLLEQYKTYLKTSEDVILRRHNTSKFYLGLNTTLVSILSSLITILNLFESKNFKFFSLLFCVLFFIFGTILCASWFTVIGNYGKLNSAKMEIISKLEEKLAVNIYDTEWQVQNDRICGKKYTSFTKIEQKIPILFMVIYGLILIAGIVLLFL